jgi:hypothetical protein
MLREYLLRLGQWLVARYSPPPPPPPPPAPPSTDIVLTIPRDALFEAAKALVAQQQQWPDRSGEAKRHQVYAALLKAHPTAQRRAVALAIEAALGD